MEIKFDPADLRPIVETVVSEILERFHTAGDRMAFSEAEAAEMLGVNPTTLGDERRRGRIEASRVGKKIRYTRQNILDYLNCRRWEPK